VKILSFEIGQKRNLSKKHEKYPINIRKYNKKYGKFLAATWLL
jgi:hypothetical protein